MTFAECVPQVQQRAHSSSSREAIQIARASLSVVADCLPETLTEELAGELPSAWADDMRRADWHPGEWLTVPELVQRIASKDKGTEASARLHLGAVLETLREALPGDLMSRLSGELPRKIDDMTETKYPVPHMHQATS